MTAYAMQLKSSAAVIHDTPRKIVKGKLRLNTRPGIVVHTYTAGPPYPVA